MNVLVMLDSAVQGQGIKLSARDWLDMGSETWQSTSDEAKAAAYQAAVLLGWKDEGLLKIMTGCWGPRVDEGTAKFTLEFLKDLAVIHPIAVEEVYKDESKPPVWKIKDCDKTLPFPN
jgi:hypothetical protein